MLHENPAGRSGDSRRQEGRQGVEGRTPSAHRQPPSLLASTQNTHTTPSSGCQSSRPYTRLSASLPGTPAAAIAASVAPHSLITSDASMPGCRESESRVGGIAVCQLQGSPHGRWAVELASSTQLAPFASDASATHLPRVSWRRQRRRRWRWRWACRSGAPPSPYASAKQCHGGSSSGRCPPAATAACWLAQRARASGLSAAVATLAGSRGSTPTMHSASTTATLLCGKPKRKGQTDCRQSDSQRLWRHSREQVRDLSISCRHLALLHWQQTAFSRASSCLPPCCSPLTSRPWPVKESARDGLTTAHRSGRQASIGITLWLHTVLGVWRCPMQHAKARSTRSAPCSPPCHPSPTLTACLASAARNPAFRLPTCIPEVISEGRRHYLYKLSEP